MQLVIADTGPINYMILIGHIDILPAVFEKIILPALVRDELKHRKAPPAVQAWIVDLPPWAAVHQSAPVRDAAADKLDAGEEDEIALAVDLGADLVLMDDREGVLVARGKGFRFGGTLGVLSMAAGHGLVDLAETFERLRRASFHYQREIMDQSLADAARLQ